VLKPGGNLIPVTAPPDQARAMQHGGEVAFFLPGVVTERSARIAAMLEQGRPRTMIDAALRLPAAHTVHEMLDGLRARPRGKIDLRVEN
jgi:hypothetical protein